MSDAERKERNDTPRKRMQSEDYISQMKLTADKFAADHASRADLKLVSTVLKELRYSLKVFSKYRHEPKVTVFGSARTDAEHPSYQQAVEFSEKIAAAGYMVVTGAAFGIMEAGHIGAGKEKSLGVNILLPFEQAANRVISGDGKLVHLKYFFTRKLMLVKESTAFAVFPGGFGTHDELFEVLTLMQTGKNPLVPLVLLEEPSGDYWGLWLKFVNEVLLPRGYISPWDLSLFKITDDVDEAVDEILRFYRNYQGMRYVGEHLVMRLKNPITDEQLEVMHQKFHDCLSSGQFQRVEVHPDELHDGVDPHQDLHRVHFLFNRQRLGRLRQMIDWLNTV